MPTTWSHGATQGRSNREADDRCRERSRFFDPIQDDEEHALVYTDLHKEFCLLFETRIEALLTEEGYSAAEFFERLMKVVDDRCTSLEGRCPRSYDSPRDPRRGHGSRGAQSSDRLQQFRNHDAIHLEGLENKQRKEVDTRELNTPLSFSSSPTVPSI